MFDSLVSIEYLEKITLQIFNQYKGLLIEDSILDILSKDEISSFIKENPDLLQKYDEVLSSIFFFNLMTFYNNEDIELMKN